MAEKRQGLTQARSALDATMIGIDTTVTDNVMATPAIIDALAGVHAATDALRSLIPEPVAPAMNKQ